MSRQRLVSRLSMLEGRRLERQKRAIVAKLAERYDLDAEEILAGADQLEKDFQRMGLVTVAEHLVYVAEEMNITTDELQAEVDALLAVCP